MPFTVLDYRFTIAAPGGPPSRLLQRLYGGPPAGSADPTETAVPRFALQPVPGAPRPGWTVSLEGHVVAQRRTLGAGLRALEYAVCTRLLAAHPQHLVLHGATLCGPQGGLLLAGPSGAGKTTLALALVTRGWRVAGDDLALLDPQTGLLWPVPRCAHLDRRSRGLLQGLGLRLPALARRYGFVSPADLGTPQPVAVAVRRILLLSRGVGAPQVQPSSQAVALLGLLAEAGWATQPAAVALAAVHRSLRGAACYRLRSGALAATADAVTALAAPP